MKFDDLYNRFYNWMITTGPKIVLAVIILLIGLWLIRLFKKWLKKILSTKRFDVSLQPFIVSFIATTLQVFLFLSVMQVLGIQMTIFAAMLGAIGVAAGLALSGTFQNFTSGILILLLKPYRVGDNIIAQGQEGNVSSIQLFYTIIVTPDNRTVIIPNSKLSNELIINISRQGNRRLDMELKFGFDVDFEKIKNILLQSLDTTTVILKDPAPEIGISSIETDGFKITVQAWVSTKEFEKNKFSIHQKLINELIKGGAKLPGL